MALVMVSSGISCLHLDLRGRSRMSRLRVIQGHLERKC